MKKKTIKTTSLKKPEYATIKKNVYNQSTRISQTKPFNSKFHKNHKA